MMDQRYRLGRVLGEGGMASVYLGEDTKLGKAIAVKVLHHEYALQPKVVQRFTQEARAISKVRHPNVVDVTDHGVTPDRSVYLVMELLHGEDLSATLDREGPMPWTRLGPIVLQICAALATVHASGIVHRDIKPSNCFRVRVAGNPDYIKVLDFGIAKVLDGPAASGAPQSTTGSLLGTPEYMAPELPRGLRPDARVDIYALGVLMYKMLTGTSPFTGEVYMAILAKHMFDPVEPMRTRVPHLDISPEVEALVQRALAKERDDRFPSMVAMAEAIAATLPGRPSAALWLEVLPDAPPPAVTGRTVVARETPTVARANPNLAHADSSPRLGPSAEDLAHADTSPRLGPSPETLAQPLRPLHRRLPLRTWLLAAAAVVAVAAVLLKFGRADPMAGDPPTVAVRGAEKLPVRTGPAGQVPADRSTSPVTAPVSPVMSPVTPPRPDAAPTMKSAGTPRTSGTPTTPTTPAARPKPTPAPTPAADLPEATDDPPPLVQPGPDSRPPLDATAATEVIKAATAKLRRCAAEQAIIGAFTLQVKIDRHGKATAIDAAPGSRKIPEQAVTCMRDVILAESFQTSARGGAVSVTLSAK